MAFDTVYLIYGGIFLAVLLLVEGIYYLTAGNRSGRDAANRRMKMLAAGASTREVFEALRRKPKDKISLFGPFKDLPGKLDRLIEKSGLTISITRVLSMMGVLTFLVFLGLVMMTKGGVVIGVTGFATGLLLSVVIGIAGPIIYLQFMKNKRLNTFSEQLPDALDVMVRSLQAGHPVSAAMTLVTKEMPDPIGTEFGIAVDEMTYGLDLKDALANLGERVGVEDFQYVVVSINIQHETGGNLAEVLDGLSQVIRARFRMFKKVRALSAEGRLSAKILASMPFVFGGLVFSSKPSFYLDAADDPLFFPFLGVAFILEVVGIYIMYKLVNFRV